MIQAPTLLIVGTADDPNILRIADTLSKTIPSVKRIDLPGAGHMINLEEPDRFLAPVEEFLRY